MVIKRTRCAGEVSERGYDAIWHQNGVIGDFSTVFDDCELSLVRVTCV